LIDKSQKRSDGRLGGDGAGASASDRPILIVSAFAPELAPLDHIGTHVGSKIGSRIDKHFGSNAGKRPSLMSTSVVAVPVGIGLIDAGIGAALAIARFSPRVILFVGTAGCYEDRPPVGSVAIARRISLASSAAARGESYFPAAMPLWTTSSPGVRRSLLRAASPGSSAFDVATPLAITRTAALGVRLASATNAAVENLEVFAVARAAHRAGIPFGAALGISNRVGPRAHGQWRRHQAAASSAACGVIERFLIAELTEPSRSAAAHPRARRPHRPE
jgi:purine-nucleoside phosphorylase